MGRRTYKAHTTFSTARSERHRHQRIGRVTRCCKIPHSNASLSIEQQGYLCMLSKPCTCTGAVAVRCWMDTRLQVVPRRTILALGYYNTQRNSKHQRDRQRERRSDSLDLGGSPYCHEMTQLAGFRFWEKDEANSSHKISAGFICEVFARFDVVLSYSSSFFSHFWFRFSFSYPLFSFIFLHFPFFFPSWFSNHTGACYQR